jgi:murein DD-endopeptidase MepM/ murein hydrolase activator NlpD
MSIPSRDLGRLLAFAGLLGAAALPAASSALVIDAPRPTSAPGATPSGATARPAVDSVTCRTRCVGVARAVAGSRVRVTGEGLGAAARIVLLGRPGRGDDVTTPASALSAAAVELTLPRRARSGPVAAVTAAGGRSAPSRAQLVVARRGAPVLGGPAVEVRADTRRLRPELGATASVSFYVRGGTPADVTVDVVGAGRRAPVAETVVPAVTPGTVESVEWDGTVAGAALPEGRYVFRVTRGAIAATGGARAATRAAAATARSAVWLVRSLFPVAGRHTYGQGFGAGRAGHRHEGQDVFAACGTPLVAARAGTVRHAGFQGAAGNFLVIAPAERGPDIVYMHLRDHPLVGAGDHVERGQRVGFVGQTGDAVGCHLHVELWTPPGWYRGGHAVDPLPALRSWEG